MARPVEDDDAPSRKTAAGGPTLRLRRMLRALIVAAASAAVFWLLAWTAAAMLTAPRPTSTPTHLLLLDGPELHAAAADWARRDPQIRLMSVEKAPSRPMQLQVLPTFEEYSRARFAELGVQPDRYEVVPGPVRTPGDLAMRLDSWLDGRSDAAVVAVCDHFAGRFWRSTFDASMTPRHAERIQIYAAPRRDFGPTDWWTCKAGRAEILRQYLRLFRL